MAQKKVYDQEFKIQAVKLCREIGFSKAAKELGVNINVIKLALYPKHFFEKEVENLFFQLLFPFLGNTNKQICICLKNPVILLKFMLLR